MSNHLRRIFFKLGFDTNILEPIRTIGRLFRSKPGLLLPALLIVTLACSNSAEPTSTLFLPTPIQDRPTPVEQPTPTSDADTSVTETGTPQPPSDVTPPGSQSTSRTPTEAPPKVDVSISSVPLEDVEFDLFNGQFLPLSLITDDDVKDRVNEVIDMLRDRIQPIYDPVYASLEEGDWLDSDDLVIGYSSESGQFAYPIKILNRHELVNDVIDDLPLVVTYCPLCTSGAVYSRILDGEELLFGNTSALYDSDLVMFDHQTGSYWYQVIGEAIVGPLTGTRLKVLPSVTTTWKNWKGLHPDTLILSRFQGLAGDRNVDRFSEDAYSGYAELLNDRNFSPAGEDKLDDRLGPGDSVVAVQVDDFAKAYLLSGQPDKVFNDEVGGRKLVVLVRSEGPTGWAYFSELDGQALTFDLDAGTLVDLETRSQWDDTGRAVSGPLAGSQLAAVPTRTAFWFSMVAAMPGIAIGK